MANITLISPPSSYSDKDINLLNASDIEVSFNPSLHYIEYVITSNNGSYVSTDYNYNNYKFLTDGTVVSNSVSQLDILPDKDLTDRGITSGNYNVYYNFYKNELLTSPNERYLLIKSISSDRTELIVKYSSPYVDPVPVVNNFFTQLNNTNYFQDFYLNFGNNNIIIANNIAVNSSTSEILINLYKPLPDNIEINDTFWVVTQIANPLAFNVEFPQIQIPITDVSFPLKGPNFNLNASEQINNSTTYQTYESLITGSLLSTSYSQLNNLLSSSGIEVNIDYTNFSNFIQFSSANQRIKNFIYKKQLIDQYQQEINILNNITTPSITSSNITILTNKINSIVENFDGYEYFLYYDSGSWSYPKSNSTIPYTLYDYGLPNVLSWLGSEDPDSNYYGGILLSASLYDQANTNYLYNSIPAYLQNDPQNDQYKLFVEMVAQHYDNVWIYYKDVTNKYNADNRLDYGISKDLVAESLKSFGIKIYQNNFTSNDLYSSFLGYGSISPEITGSLPVTTDSFQEYINNYITASYDASIIPLDDYNKEVYKRIYNNLSYLSKTKGTIPGLRALINCFGVPDTILRISEFGGRDKDTSTYDYFYNRFSYALSTTSGSDSRAYAQIPWAPLLNSATSSGDGVGYVALQYVLENYVYREGGGAGNIASASLPNNLEFRFKTNGIPSNYNTQSLLIKTNTSYDAAVDDWNIGIFLNYDQPFSASSPYYDGDGSIATNTPYQGNLFFILNNNSTGNYIQSSPIQLPFFDGGWWSVMLQRNKNVLYGDGNDENITYTLYAANKLYDSEEGNTIGFIGSSSIQINGLLYPDLNEAWNSYQSFAVFEAGVYLGGHYSGSNLSFQPFATTSSFDGCFQEFRYYSLPLDVKTFKDYTMNPTSIEGLQLTGVSGSFNTLGFRAPLGNELWNYAGSAHEEPFISSINNTQDDKINFDSIHPAITASSDLLITASFIDLNTQNSFSEYDIIYPYNPNANTPETFYISQNEVYYFDQPIVGIKNRVTDKIQIKNSSYPSGSVLSQYRSLEQNYPTLDSEVPNINMLEVAFSPQNEVNDDITNQLGYFNIGEYIGDPRQVSSPSTTYPDLVKLSENFFQKYFTSYDLFDYMRLIKYFDNSLFKMIQDFVPARTSLTSGVVVKQHLLERNRYPEPQLEWEELDYSGSIDTAFMSGGTGGTFNSYNFTGSTIPPTFINNTQSWGEEVKTPVGLLTISHSTQDEFYNGELPYSSIIVDTGELNGANPFKEQNTTIINYTPVLYINSAQYYHTQPYDITPLEIFLNPKTTPDSGEIYLWYDDSIFNNNTPYAVPSYTVNSYSPSLSVKKIKFIKISKTSYDGEINANTLQLAQNISINLLGTAYSYPICGVQEFATYYLYTIGPYLPNGSGQQLTPNIPISLTSSLAAVKDYRFNVTASLSISDLTTSYLATGTDITGFSVQSGNTLGYWNVVKDLWNPQQTPNPEISVFITLQGTNTSGHGVTLTTGIANEGFGNTPFITSQSSNIPNGTGFNITFNFQPQNNIWLNDYFLDDDVYIFVIKSSTADPGVSITKISINMSQSPNELIGTPSLTVFNPFLDTTTFSYDQNDFNPLNNNVENSVSSNIFMDVDYSQNPIYPVNQSLIIAGTADKAPVHDSNYKLKSWSNLRYNGSRYNSIIIKTNPFG